MEPKEKNKGKMKLFQNQLEVPVFLFFQEDGQKGPCKQTVLKEERPKERPQHGFEAQETVTDRVKEDETS